MVVFASLHHLQNPSMYRSTTMSYCNRQASKASSVGQHSRPLLLSTILEQTPPAKNDYYAGYSPGPLPHTSIAALLSSETESKL